MRVGCSTSTTTTTRLILVSTKSGRQVKVFDWEDTKTQIDAFNVFTALYKTGLFVAGG